MFLRLCYAQNRKLHFPLSESLNFLSYGVSSSPRTSSRIATRNKPFLEPTLHHKRASTASASLVRTKRVLGEHGYRKGRVARHKCGNSKGQFMRYLRGKEGYGAGAGNEVLIFAATNAPRGYRSTPHAPLDALRNPPQLPIAYFI
jgi:hypothetical protein